MLHNSTIYKALMSLTCAAFLAGCAGRAELIPNGDPSLRKTAAEFAADSAKRFPYKANAAQGGEADARAEIEYVLDRVRLINFSNQDWDNVEVWINGQYVVFLPKLECKATLGDKALKSIPFQSFYNDAGQSFPTSNGKWFMNRDPVIVQKIELYRDGKIFSVPSDMKQ